jgi:hypothetical protein
MVEKNGKQISEKVGLKSVQRNGVEYEYSICMELDIKHFATASKDRTGLFADQTPFRISKETGELIKRWCEEGVDDPLKEVTKSIGECMIASKPMLQVVNHLQQLLKWCKTFTGFLVTM